MPEQFQLTEAVVMADEYQLQTLLELREQERDDAEDRCAQELQELRRREQFVADKRQDLADAQARRRRQCDSHDRRVYQGEASLVEIQAFAGYLDGLKRQESDIQQAIERAVGSCERQKQQVADAKQALIEATTELKAVQKHHEAWRKKQAARDKRRRAAAMDEVAARRWMEDNQ